MDFHHSFICQLLLTLWRNAVPLFQGFEYVVLYSQSCKNYLTTCSKVLLEKLLVPQLVKKFPAFSEPDASSLYLQEPSTCPYPEPHNLVSAITSYFFKIHFLSPATPFLNLPSGLILSYIPTKTLCIFFSHTCSTVPTMRLHKISDALQPSC